MNKLEVAWSYDDRRRLSYTFCPLVVDNIAYVAAKAGRAGGARCDHRQGTVGPHFRASGGARSAGSPGQRGANYWESKDRSDRRILVTSGGMLHAIDARTGKLVDSFADHGKLDLKTGIDRATAPLALAERRDASSKTLIILGSATGEGYLAPPGDIRAFDVVTGKLVWVFHTIPRPGEFGYDTWPKDAYKYMGGVDVWGEITVDEKRGIVYLPHGIRQIRALRRRPAGRQSVRGLPARARCAHRQTSLAFPDGSSRSLGLRSRRRAATGDRDA